MLDSSIRCKESKATLHWGKTLLFKCYVINPWVISFLHTVPLFFSPTIIDDPSKTKHPTPRIFRFPTAFYLESPVVVFCYHVILLLTLSSPLLIVHYVLYVNDNPYIRKDTFLVFTCFCLLLENKPHLTMTALKK